MAFLDNLTLPLKKVNRAHRGEGHIDDIVEPSENGGGDIWDGIGNGHGKCSKYVDFFGGGLPERLSQCPARVQFSSPRN